MEIRAQTAKLNDVAATHHSGVPALMTAMSYFRNLCKRHELSIWVQNDQSLRRPQDVGEGREQERKLCETQAIAGLLLAFRGLILIILNPHLIRPDLCRGSFRWWIIPLVIFTNSALAQSTTGTISFDQIAQFLQRDIFLQPGVGFKRVQIGQSFDHVLQAWGQPQATRNRGLFRNTHEWFYGGGKDTVVSVKGKATVSEITIRGTFTTPFQTIDGARFGMAPHEIVTIYGRNADSSSTRLTYASRGVGFEFADGAVNAIIVAAPR